MKYLMFFLSVFVGSVVFAQDRETAYFESNPELGGDVIIRFASVKVVGNDLYKSFEIESFESGSYYLDAWILPSLTQNGYPEFKVEINGVLSKSTFKPQATGWQSLALTDKKKSTTTVELRKGINSVSIIGQGPEYPSVECVKLSLSPLNTGISDEKYREFVELIKSGKMSGTGMLNDTLDHRNDISLRSSTGYYDYLISMPVYYTTRLYMPFTSNQNVQISTTQSGTFAHVIELFHENNSNLASYSWVSAPSYNCSLNVTIPVAGNYYIRVRAFQQYTLGYVNLTVNGVSKGLCEVSGSGITTSTYYPTSAYYFTCQLNGGANTWLFLEEPGVPGKIRAYNHDGGSFGDFYSSQNWTSAALITNTSVSNIAAGLVSAHASNLPTATCDLYMGLKPLTPQLIGWFKHLVQGAAFISGPKNANYNCIAWSVGITNTDKQLTNLTGADAFYYGYGYTRVDSTASDGAIAIWGVPDDSPDGFLITHASVRKNSTIPHPHGFSWESKLGWEETIMHAKKGLYESDININYGRIYCYYKPITGTVSLYSLLVDENEENLSAHLPSTEQPLVIIPAEESYFTQSDLNRIANLKDLLPTTVITDFEKKYVDWKNTWSRPDIALKGNLYREKAKSNEYNSLLNYSLKYGKAMLPLIYERLKQSDIYVVNLLEDLTFHENRHIYDDLLSYFNSKVEPGKPVPSDLSIYIDYSKKLLEIDFENILKSIRDISISENKVFEANAISIHNQEIVLSLYAEYPKSAIVNIYNIFGGLEYEEGYHVPKGGFTAVIDASHFKKGIYVVQIILEGKTTSQKISI